MILTTILVVVGFCFGGVVADSDRCCHYPISTTTINSANVTSMNFKCVEPISLKCQNVNSGVVKKIGIAGFKDRSDTSKYTILSVSEEELVEKTMICSPSTMWHLEEKPEDEYLSFSCAYMLQDGTWFFQ
ncbi:hypothetical protein GCK72_004821 [Caenorhabditis remanei]|uniref:C6 domain-containing protein n=1 Tax=Caenorhabditis remanei TaxID=31234 RepID=E3MZT2_CAERE|nr:hypothetical protein GCK72_004821 [Caenorhabditis remanei]EFP13102.1 hypothetical protein CRE_07718 [Caenorhabditis remanei]KAF1764871.1 hypothetical protein GCK72_004821 [Caenorhabditis remanei]